MNCHTKRAESLQGPISLTLGILLSSPPAPFVLLPNLPDKQRLFQSVLKPDSVSQKPRRFVPRHKFTFSEQVREYFKPSPHLPDCTGSVPPGVREKVIPRLRCLQKVMERTPKHFCPYRATPEYKLTYYVETLTCGHQVFSYPPAHVAKRRNCPECLKSLQSSPETGAPVVSAVGGSVLGNALCAPLPPFSSSEKKPVQSATESGVITDDVYLAKR